MTLAAEALAAARPRMRPLAFVRRHVLTVYSLLAFTYLLLPIGIVVMFSFNNPRGRFNYVWEGFTWSNWLHWDAVPGLRSALEVSLEIAALSSVCATALGTLLRFTQGAVDRWNKTREACF